MVSISELAPALNSFSPFEKYITTQSISKAFPYNLVTSPVKQEKEKETSMSIMELEARNHLTRRLDGALWNKKLELQTHFGLTDEAPPRTAKELVERLKEGRFLIEIDESVDEDSGFYWKDAIRWRNPDLKEDREGYAAAKASSREAYNQVMDIIMVKSPDDGLTALQEFLKKDFSKRSK